MGTAVPAHRHALVATERRSASFMAGMSTSCGQRVTHVWQEVHSQMKRLASTLVALAESAPAGPARAA